MASSIPLQRAASNGLRMQAATATATASSSRQSLLLLQSQTFFSRRLLLQRPPTRTARIQNQYRPNSTKTNSSSSQSPPPSTSAPTPTTTPSRLDRILTRTSRYLPPRLRAPLHQFRRAPVSHVAAFLVLHELTAVVPLLGLTGAFYYLDVVPVAWVFGWWAPYAHEGGTKALRYFKKKGWFGLAVEEDSSGVQDEKENKMVLRGEERLERELAEREGDLKKKNKQQSWFALLRRKGDGKDESGEAVEEGSHEKSKARRAAAAVKDKVTWDNSETGYKLGIQIVAAYAITKVLLIPRVALSLWLTPSFARAMVWSRKLIFKR